MKPHLDISHKGTLTGDRVRMKFHEESIAHLMSVLIDLYADSEMAVIREYSTNAWDAHVAAGITDPIEVILPSDLAPLLVIRDHGVGMSVEDILERFSQYGYSSKRDTNEAVGMLGLGCKSGLAYTSQFTFVARQNGVEATVLVTREEDGGASLQVVYEDATDEPNGVEVQIPCRHAQSVRTKVNQFFRYWEPGSVVVRLTNGELEEPYSIWSDPNVQFLDPDIAIVHEDGPDLVVMGGVAYPSPRKLSPWGRRGNFYGDRRVVARVPIGAVDFAPSREALQTTNRTNDSLSEIDAWVTNHVIAEAEAAMAKAENGPEAIKAALNWQPLVSPHPLTWRGKKVPVRIDLVLLGEPKVWNAGTPNEHVDPPHNMGALGWQSYDVEDRADRYTTLDAASLARQDHGYGDQGNILVVTGFSGSSLHRGLKERTKLWIEKQKTIDPNGPRWETRREYPKVYFCQTVDTTWLARDQYVSIDTIREVQLPKVEKEKRPKPPYRLIWPDGSVGERPELPEGIVIVVGVPADMNQDQRRWAKMLVECYPKHTAISVPKRSTDRFLREHQLNPLGLMLKDFVERELKEVRINSSAIEHWLMVRDAGYSDALPDILRMTGVNDPEMTNFIREVKVARDLSKIATHLDTLARPLDLEVPRIPKDWEGIAHRYDRILKRYPLLHRLLATTSRQYRHDVEAVTQYLNDTYAANLYRTTIPASY